MRRCLISMAILTIKGSDGFSNIGHKLCSKGTSLPFCTLRETSSSQNHEKTLSSEDHSNVIPKRKDTCKLILSGIIGTEPKEAYLSNNHYVINFALAVVGHYDFIHEWEKSKVLIMFAEHWSIFVHAASPLFIVNTLRLHYID